MSKQSRQDRQRGGRHQAAYNNGVGSIIRRDLLALLTSRNVRETLESIVIAFALAFLFRTFEAEAFVIPTGSMAPTLQGRHQDVTCPMCGYDFRISASSEIDQETEVHRRDVASGTCPNCGYTACTNKELGMLIEERHQRWDDLKPFNYGAVQTSQDSGSRNGDRILVSKFEYEFGEPERWDVFVFRYPLESARNYIKRLVGLPGETLKIQYGDVFRAGYVPIEQVDSVPDKDFKIERKPPHKILAMAQMIYDNDHQAEYLRKAGWPRRWKPAGEGVSTWTIAEDDKSFSTDGTADGDALIRYEHLMASWQDWEDILEGRSYKPPKPQLVPDMYAYNTGFAYAKGSRKGWDLGIRADEGDKGALGIHWVGDLVVKAEVDVTSKTGELIFELVEGGRTFQSRIDVATGEASLSIDGGSQGFEPAAGETSATTTFPTKLKGPGTYEVSFANVDDQLVLWVDGDLVARAPYKPLGNRMPTPQDLSPVGIGSRGAAVTVRKLRLLRDVYYLATEFAAMRNDGYSPDYQYGPLSHSQAPTLLDDFEKQRVHFLSTPREWPAAFRSMSQVRFSLKKDAEHRNKDQFMALGDNSPQSKDSRLWAPKTNNGEFYVERELLIGKALAIYWPLTHFSFVR